MRPVLLAAVLLCICFAFPATAADLSAYERGGHLDKQTLEGAPFADLAQLAQRYKQAERYGELAEVLRVWVRQARFADQDQFLAQAEQAVKSITADIRRKGQAELDAMRSLSGGRDMETMERSLAAVRNARPEVDAALRDIRAFLSAADGLKARLNARARELNGQPLIPFIRDRAAIEAAQTDIKTLKDQVCAAPDATGAGESFRQLMTRSSAYDPVRDALHAWKQDMASADPSRTPAGLNQELERVADLGAKADESARSFGQLRSAAGLDAHLTALDRGLSATPDQTALNDRRQNIIELSTQHEAIASAIMSQPFLYEREFWDGLNRKAVQMTEGSDSMAGRIQTVITPAGRPAYRDDLATIAAFQSAARMDELYRQRGILDAVLTGAARLNRALNGMDGELRLARQCVTDISKQQTAQLQQDDDQRVQPDQPEDRTGPDQIDPAQPGTGPTVQPGTPGGPPAPNRLPPLQFTFNTQPLNATSAGITSTGYHAFATGSRLGWAATLSRWSGGWADQAIIEHMRVAERHIEEAWRNSIGPLPAWKNYKQINASLEQRITNLQDVAADPGARYREQLAVSLDSLGKSLADQIGWQYAGRPVKMENCESNYTLLGLYLGSAHQGLLVAANGAANGVDRNWTDKVRAEAMMNIQNASRILAHMPDVKVLTGACADLAPVYDMVRAVTSLPRENYQAQADQARRAWEEALRRIQAMGGGSGTEGPDNVVQPQGTPPADGLTDFYVTLDMTFLGSKNYPDWFNQAPPEDASKAEKKAFGQAQRKKAVQWARTASMAQAVEFALQSDKTEPQVLHFSGRAATDFPSGEFTPGSKWALPMTYRKTPDDGPPEDLEGTMLLVASGVFATLDEVGASGVDLEDVKTLDVAGKGTVQKVVEDDSVANVGPLTKGWTEADRRENFVLTAQIAIALAQMGVALDKCFAETAAGHTGLDPDSLDPLRRFRDNVLDRTPAGRRLVAFYYRQSPRLKELFDKAPGLYPVAGLAVQRLNRWAARWCDREDANDMLVGRLIRAADFLAALVDGRRDDFAVEPAPAPLANGLSALALAEALRRPSCVILATASLP